MQREKTMLIADDVELNRALLENIFDDEYSILQAADGVEAMEILRSQPVDVVLLDIVMPRMDGFEVLKTMKEEEALSGIPVIMATSEKENSEERALLLGADDFINKPYRAMVVKKRVENIVVKHILERKRLENALFETRNELNSLIDSVPGGIGVWKVTDKVQVEYFNDGFCRQFGYDREEFQEKFSSDLTALWVGGDTEYILNRLRENKDSNDRISLVHQVRRKDKSLRWFSLNALKYKVEDGVPVFRIVNIDVTESRENELLIEQKNEELRYLLDHDALTGLYNRSTFCRKTADFLRQNPEGTYNMVQFDIERFKVINELYGNFMGDRILLLIAEGLQKCLKSKGTYGRLEADHFAVCLPAGTEELQQVRDQMEKSLASVKIEQKINLYYGVYTIEDRGMSVDLMCDRANLALRTVKGNSNRAYAVYNDELHQVVLSEQQLTNSMEEALLQRQFEVYYQPVVDLNTGDVVSAEALVRWNHPEKGMVSPGFFIPFFEHNGFIIKLDAYIREEVCRNMMELRRRGLKNIPVSVNVSRLEFYDPNLCRSIIDLTERYRLEPQMMRLEITESAYTDNPQQLLAAMKELQNYGFQVLMDDFGSGYSSLNMLKDVPVDILKMDMKFLEDQGISGRGPEILASLVRMAKKLGMRTIAEGIETKEQGDFLRSVGCEYGQGYYYARPMPADSFTSLLMARENVK
ncbi:MAG: EAL domain-containing protein [Blautia sp.]|uniref:Stage 0 sporulation protein A homolog n=1 Tax=Blautia parvula TaxID=2877527 RepID=A0ABQ0BYM9_9FIRM|nr:MULTISPECIES: EAL domain-containing protein [Blautia]MCB6724979.1 EAL domain-containing protein [Blautia marasmi]MCI5966658.1 EAL domain-containing protein [Clostridia bacterium]MCQ4736705.1 EAL domain-containing protein [Blautia hominis]MCQ5094297.1 EAL domain-containing protein [Blautia producta]MDY4055578.1 EAL domain-containing protein [Blautia sp.]